MGSLIRSKIVLKRTLFLSLLTANIACGDLFAEEGGEDQGRGRGREEEALQSYGKLRIIAAENDTTALNLSAVEEQATACTMFADAVPSEDGFCATPLSVTGFVSAISAQSASRDPLERGPARLFAQSEASEGPGQILSGGYFDLANPTQNLVGNNTLVGPVGNKPSFRTEPRVTFNEGVMSLQHLRYRFQLQGKFVEVLVSRVPQPYAQPRHFANCEGGAPSEEILSQERYQEANLVKGLTFEAGDYLYCVQDTNTSCAEGDFKWLDLDSLTLTSERPTQPHQAPSLAVDPMCVVSEGPRGGQSFDLDWGNLNILFAFPEGKGFQLHADFTHGEISEQWKDEKWPFGAEPEGGEDLEGTAPWPYYTHVSEEGQVSEGGDLEIELALSTDGLLFFALDEESELENESLETLLSKMTFTSVWIQDQIKQRNLPGAGLARNLPAPQATAKVTVTGGQNPPTPLQTLISTSGQETDTP